MLLWASKFATAKIECSFEMGKWTPLGVPFILHGIVPATEKSVDIVKQGIKGADLSILFS